MTKYRESNMDKQREWNRRSYRNHAAAICLKTNAYRKANLDKARQYSKTWREKYPDKALDAERKQYAKNPLRFYTKNRRRHASKLNATPAWANPTFIEDMYMLARLVSEATGIKHHVDHVVPIRSKKVCGLHVEHNLQVIPATENSRKQNLTWPDMAA